MDEIKVTIKKEDQADITRQVLDGEVCKHFTDEQPYFILLFIEIIQNTFEKIGELSRMQHVADVIKEADDEPMG